MRITKKTAALGLFGATVVLALMPDAGSAAVTAAPGTVSIPSGSLSSGSLNCTQLEALWERAGGSPSAAFMAAEVARAESGGRQYATDNNTNGSTDRGYWQINSIWGAGSTYDPLGNAKAAVSISQDGTNWSPWVTWQRGMYAGQC